MATKKAAVPQDEKFENTDLDIFKVLEAIDKKDYGWYDRLTEEQQKKFVPYVITHWMSAIKANGMLGAYYVMSTDQNANKHLFNERVQQHPKLQWLMLCAASPGMGKQFHQWIPHLNAKLGELKSVATKKEVKDYFTKVFSGASQNDIDDAATQYVKDQQHKVRLAKMFPEMKISDIEALSKVVNEQDIDDYEKQSGN
jgi:hypothetical protein